MCAVSESVSWPVLVSIFFCVSLPPCLCLQVLGLLLRTNLNSTVTGQGISISSLAAAGNVLATFVSRACRCVRHTNTQTYAHPHTNTSIYAYAPTHKHKNICTRTHKHMKMSKSDYTIAAGCLRVCVCTSARECVS